MHSNFSVHRLRGSRVTQSKHSIAAFRYITLYVNISLRCLYFQIKNGLKCLDKIIFSRYILYGPSSGQYAERGKILNSLVHFGISSKMYPCKKHRNTNVQTYLLHFIETSSPFLFIEYIF